jgi:transposase
LCGPIEGAPLAILFRDIATAVIPFLEPRGAMVVARCLPFDPHSDAPVCLGCRQRDQRIAHLEVEVADLKAEIQRLRRSIATWKGKFQKANERSQRNASNSSLPPSANPLDAPMHAPKQPSGRKPGGQPGHPPYPRQRMPPARVTNVVPFIPDICGHCQTPLPAEATPNDPEPTWHQVAELPEFIAQITEYQGHGRTCPCCSRVTVAKIPDDIRRFSVGPRLAAALAYLSGSPHVSKRGLDEIADTLFQAPIALGTVSNLEAEMSAALKSAHTQAQEAVRDARVKNVDETGWKQAGKKRWLWLATTARVACYLIHTGRGAAGFLSLIGGKIKGIFVSDRWHVYDRVPLSCRQICWAHLKRDFQKLVDLGGAGRTHGKAGLAIATILFHEWQLFRGGGSRHALQRELEPVRDALREWLQEGTRCRSPKAATLCTSLLSLEPALWTFLYKPGVEPTNNHGERLVRSGVLWRKIAFGCHSERGCRFVERILTVVGTLRLQQRPVLDFLYRSLLAHRNGDTPPTLVDRG